MLMFDVVVWSTRHGTHMAENREVWYGIFCSSPQATESGRNSFTQYIPRNNFGLESSLSVPEVPEVPEVAPEISKIEESATS